ncbi:hypothetical protein AAG906_035694 [Vitis piasezkii]
MGHDVEVPTKGNLAVHIDDMDENLAQNDEMGRGEGGGGKWERNLALVTQLIMIATNNYIDISFTNENDDVEFYDEDEIKANNYDDEPLTNKTSLDDSEHIMPSPMFKQLNWDAINNMIVEPLTSRIGLWNESNELFKGLRFESKEDLQYEGCNWRLRAYCRKIHRMFEITKYAGSHTCVYPKLSQDHSQLGSHHLSLLQIVNDKFGYDVHYKRIWETKRKAMLRVFGDWDESYQALSKWMNILKLTNPGIKIVWKTIPLGGIFGNVRFMRVFWTFGPSIEGFKHWRPIIQIDGTFLYEKYMGKLLIAASIDANGHIFLLMFEIIEEES